MAYSIDVSTALANLQELFTSLRTFIVSLSYITGIALIFRGIGMYRAFGQHITMHSRGGELAGPMVFMVVGAFLIYLPSTLSASLITVFGKAELTAAGEILSLTGDVDDTWQEISSVLSNYLSLLGLIAFVRGWIILSKMGHSGSQPGSVAKGITHLIGGIFLLNIVETVKLVAELFGINV